jgi:choline dehydrogenase
MARRPGHGLPASADRVVNVDYIIVGGGAAGCVLAYRLSGNPSTSVLLLEAGGSDRHPFIQMPRGIAKVMSDPNFMWPYMTNPEPGSNDLPESWGRGRTLGGSSSVNGMVYVRGQDADYDALAAMTSDDWSWKHIGQAYRALENHELGPSPTRGDRGPLRISLPDQKWPVIEAAIQAGMSLGLERKTDVNDPADVPRIGYAPRTIYKGRRQSASTAFLDPARGRKNLIIVTQAVVDSVEFDGRRAVAVRVLKEGQPVTYRANREIVLSAGTMASAAILQRSGVGPAKLLAKYGIPLVQESNEVGANVREHRGIVMQWRIRAGASQNQELQGVGLVASTARYAMTRGGALAAGVYDAGAWFKTRADSPRPDAQILMAPYSINYENPAVGVEAHPGMNFCVYNLRPESTGTVSIRSRNPAEVVEIQPGYATAEVDRTAMLAGICFVRRLIEQPPLRDYVVEETRPGSDYQTDEELVQAHLKFGYGNFHACGSCRMGHDAQSVVDPQLRVRGIEGLRVVDTSIFPFMLSGNTCGPAMATAWRAADLILEGQA